ncbi:thioredoxin family protein [Candidatus Palauibacter sp.]|uniref:protein-disulfide reductase DsbD family protein n=1 Tax=Candidatus Palauibacter sp. TaxID=3101350 RepID=UPI003B53043A
MFVTSGRRNERGAHLEERRTMVVGLRGRTAEARIRRERGPAPAIAVLLAVAAGSVFPTPGSAQIPQQGVFDLEKGDISVALDRTAYLAGEPAELAVRLVIEDGWHANSNQPTYDYLIATAVDLELPPDWPPARAVGYPPGEMKTFSFAPTAISVYEGEVFVRASVPTPAGASPGTYPIRANVTYQACDDKMCLAPVTTPATVGLTVGTGGQAANPEFFAADAGDGTAAAGQAAGSGRGFLWFVLLGFVGGLILNAMPCVLPILSLKVFGLVKSAEGGRRAVTAGGLATAAGIILSFLLLAAAAIVARSAGVAVGWGIQFQEPLFVGALAVVMLFFTLNMWGLFEIPLPASLAKVGSTGPSEGLAGHLATGFFATLMATPCSAPFLGTALGFALTQDSGTTAAMFGAIGTGMASPYLLLAAFPAAGRVLPKPGAWMATFKVVMGFLLAATLVWLLFVLSGLVPAARVAFFEVGLLAVALAVWLGSRRGRGGPARRVAGLAAAALAVLAVTTVAQGRGEAGSPALGVAPEDRLIAWEPFDRDRAEELSAAGSYVFVDVTADWCFTCKVNEALFLETEEVAGAFEEHDVIAMRADWTRRDESIGRYLADFGRYGIPFYVLYRPGRGPHVFSELISKSAILDMLGD